jgi:hypothetical protein
MVWLKNILRFQEAVLKRFREAGTSGRGRALMLRVYSSLNFFDQNFKKIANENTHLMRFMLKSHEQGKDEQTADQTEQSRSRSSMDIQA